MWTPFKKLSTLAGNSVVVIVASFIAGPSTGSAAVVFDSFTADPQSVISPPLNSSSTYATGAGVLGGGRRLLGHYNSNGSATVDTGLGTFSHISSSGDGFSYSELNYGNSRYFGNTFDHPMNLDLTGSTGITFVVDAFSGSAANAWYVHTNVEGTPTTLSVVGAITGVGTFTIPWASFGAVNLADIDAMSSYWQNASITISEIRIEGISESSSAGTPEPGTFALGALGLVGLGLMAWRRKRRSDS